MPNRETSRRDFLSFLAGSPLLAAAGLDSKTFHRLFGATPRGAEQAMVAAQPRATQSTVIQSANDALDVLDFEAAAKAKIPVAHWGYLSTGTDDDATIRANREGYERWALRPRH